MSPPGDVLSFCQDDPRRAYRFTFFPDLAASFVSWEVFSSTVMRETRSAARDSKGRSGADDGRGAHALPPVKKHARSYPRANPGGQEWRGKRAKASRLLDSSPGSS